MSTTQDGYTPLVTAANFGKCDVVIELLDNGANINAQTDVSPCNTVIMYITFIPHLNYFKSAVSCRLIGVYIITPTGSRVASAVMAQTSSWVS